MRILQYGLRFDLPDPDRYKLNSSTIFGVTTANKHDILRLQSQNVSLIHIHLFYEQHFTYLHECRAR